MSAEEKPELRFLMHGVLTTPEAQNDVIEIATYFGGNHPQIVPRFYAALSQTLEQLCYWREYRSQFHIGSSFGVSEATVCRTIQKVEKALLDDQRFHLPGKKALWERESSTLELVVVVVDASEQRVERPQAKKTVTILLRQEEMPHSKGTNRD